jgi:hypothetical protein
MAEPSWEFCGTKRWEEGPVGKCGMLGGIVIDGNISHVSWRQGITRGRLDNLYLTPVLFPRMCRD